MGDISMSDDRRGVPMVAPRKRREIEAYADRLVREVYPDRYDKPTAIPVDDFFEFILPTRFQVKTHVSDRLPSWVEGMAFPPGVSGDYPEILLAQPVYERLLDNQPRARFTAAHECLHGLLHLKEIRMRLVDGHAPALYRRQEIARYRDPEWQADVFAGTFLLPTPAVTAFVERYGADPDAMAEIFMVSVRAAELRLHYLGGGGLVS